MRAEAMVMPTDNMHVRNKISKTDDSGKQQVISSTGRKRESLGNDKAGMPKLQSYGFTYHQPKGSHAITMMLNGDPDQAMAISAEHPDFRPTGLLEGEWKLYDKWGSYCHAKSDGWHFVVGQSELTMLRSGEVTIKCVNITHDTSGKTFLGKDADKPLGMLGSTDNDTELNGADALVGNLSTKANTK
jgi:phage gp45-like